MTSARRSFPVFQMKHRQVGTGSSVGLKYLSAVCFTSPWSLGRTASRPHVPNFISTRTGELLNWSGGENLDAVERVCVEAMLLIVLFAKMTCLSVVTLI